MRTSFFNRFPRRRFLVTFRVADDSPTEARLDSRYYWEPGADADTTRGFVIMDARCPVVISQ